MTGSKETQKLKILCVGNSFNQDVIAYLPPVLRGAVPEAEITCGVLYIGSGKLTDHIRMFREDIPYTCFYYWSEGASSWKWYAGPEAKTLRQVLHMEEWTVITMQGNTSDVLTKKGIDAMYASASELLGILRKEAGYPFEPVWFEWPGRQHGLRTSSQMHALVRAASAEIPARTQIKTVVPVGTAIQTAREDPDLSGIGSSPEGALMFSDNMHLQAGLPALLSAYTTAAGILAMEGMDPAAVRNAAFVPTRENALAIRATNGRQGGMTHGDPDGVTDRTIRIAAEIAVGAVCGNNPGSKP